MTLILAYTPSGISGGHPTLAEAVADLRQDLFDCTQGIGPADAAAGIPPPPRWSDDALARALDRAVDEYSFVAPLARSVMTATLPGVRAYGLPPDAWWIESVEYPSGLYPPRMVPFEELVTPGLGTPAAPLAVAAGVAGPLTGSYVWSVTFVKSGGETLPGLASAPLILSGGAAALSDLPLGPPGTVGRRIYRAMVTETTATGPVTGTPRLAGQLLDNTTTSWTDAVPDGLLGATAPTTDTTANLPQFVLRLAPGRVPTDTSGVLTVTYAAKHSLTPAGTSLPERHHDVVLLGAAAYAMLAYQAPTNDLFEYQDGELHDRVDEHTVPVAWLAAATAMLARFTARLEDIKRQNNAGIAAVARWGDVPVAWQRT